MSHFWSIVHCPLVRGRIFSKSDSGLLSENCSYPDNSDLSLLASGRIYLFLFKFIRLRKLPTDFHGRRREFTPTGYCDHWSLQDVEYQCTTDIKEKSFDMCFIESLPKYTTPPSRINCVLYIWYASCFQKRFVIGNTFLSFLKEDFGPLIKR